MVPIKASSRSQAGFIGGNRVRHFGASTHALAKNGNSRPSRKSFTFSTLSSFQNSPSDLVFDCTTRSDFFVPFVYQTEQNSHSIHAIYSGWESFMPRRKNVRELVVRNVSNHRYMGPISVDGIESELQPFNSERVSIHPDCARPASPFVSERTLKIKDYSVSRQWHRPYIEALFEPDEAMLGALIAEAERAIVGRFLQLLIASVETDETLDLHNAAYVITELKKASVVAYTPQHLVA